jgi:antitoxin CptB
MPLYMPAPAPGDDMPDLTASLDLRRRRLVFRARHRGTREADLLIGGFVTRHVANLSEAELDSLEAVLDHAEVDLTDWLSGRRAVPPEASCPMLDRLVAECAASGAGIPEESRRP